jgi:hypothetical protein
MISPILLAKRCHRSVARSFVASWGGMEATWAYFGTMAPNGCGRICKAPVAGGETRRKLPGLDGDLGDFRDPEILLYFKCFFRCLEIFVTFWCSKLDSKQECVQKGMNTAFLQIQHLF